MTITTFATLKSAIADWLNRDDLTSVVPTFVALAEASLARDVRHWRMETRSTATIDARFSAVPSDWLESIRLYVTGEPQDMDLISQAEMTDRRTEADDEGGAPRFYCMTAGQFEFFPTPDESYTLELLYYAKPAVLSADGDANWLLTNYPDAYLYGSLVHSAPYLKDDARTILWGEMYRLAIEAINNDNHRAKFGGAGLRMKVRSF